MIEFMLSDKQYNQLIKNGSPGEKGKDHVPVVYMFAHKKSYKKMDQWMISELYQDKPDVGFGLFVLDGGVPQFGEIDLKVIEEQYRQNCGIAVSPSFFPEDTLSVFREVANEVGFIPSHEELLGKSFRAARKKIKNG